MPETNRATIAAYLREHYQALVGYVRSMIEDTAARDGEDIVQDVILSLLGRADDAGPIESLSAYVYRALRNRVIDELRRPARDVLSLEAGAAPDSALTLADVLADLRYDPAEVLEGEETRECIYQAIRSLPSAQRAVIIATELQGRSFRELAQEWSVPIGTLLARKARGLEALRARIALTCDQEEVPT